MARAPLSVVLYHLATREAWGSALDVGRYEPPSLAAEGFIHCSTASQYVEVANRLYANRDDLVLLFVDPTRIAAPVRVEGGFPHIYGPLDLAAVFEIDAFARDAGGRFTEHLETPGLEIFGAMSLDAVVARASEVMAGFDAPWFIAGGWACDLFLGRRTRPHADLEISILRRDLPALFEHLRDRQVAIADHGRLFPWPGPDLTPDHHQIWSRDDHGALEVRAFVNDPTCVGFLIEESDGAEWVYRRDPTVRTPLADFGVRARGAPIVHPMIVALFKSRRPRRKDARDLDALLPSLTDEQRSWLRASLI